MSCPYLVISWKGQRQKSIQGHETAFSPKKLSAKFLREELEMKWETLINFPAEQSIKAPPSCSDSHCGSKGRNYIVKNSTCPGWQRPPWKVTYDWHSIWGSEPGLADRVGEAKGKSEISLLTTSTQTPGCPSGGVLWPFSPINNQSEQLTELTIWTPPEIQNKPCPNPLPNPETCGCVFTQGRVQDCGWVGVHALVFLHEKKNMKCAFNSIFRHDSWTAKPVCLAILIYDKNQP